MKNVIITGSSRGFGKALTDKFTNRGHNVIPHTRNDEQYKGDSIVGDLRHPHFLLLESLEYHLQNSNVDIFVNNAAIYLKKPFLECSQSDIRDVFSINVIGQINVLKVVYEHFAKRGSGVIININSLAGLQPTPNEALYCASKHALTGFSKSLQIEAIGSGVRFLDIYPGAMKTDMAAHRDNFEHLIEPSEVANTICDIVLSDNASSFPTELVIRRTSCE